MEQRQRFPSWKIRNSAPEYNITKMVDDPPSGYARVDAFFTSKGDGIYAMLPRLPAETCTSGRIFGTFDGKGDDTGNGRRSHWKASGSGIEIEVPQTVREKLEFSQLHTLKLEGMKQTG